MASILSLLQQQNQQFTNSNKQYSEYSDEATPTHSQTNSIGTNQAATQSPQNRSGSQISETSDLINLESDKNPDEQAPGLKSNENDDGPDEFLSKLDERYFTAQFDSEVAILKELSDYDFNQSTDDPNSKPYSGKDQRISQISFLEYKLNQLDMMKLEIQERLSKQILKHYESFIDGLQLIDSVKSDLSNALEKCRNARAELKSIKQNLTKRILLILIKFRKLKRIQMVIDQLEIIDSVLRSQESLNRFIRQQQYKTAIEEYRNCTKLMSSSDMKQFQCSTFIENQLTISVQSLISSIRLSIERLMIEWHSETGDQMFAEIIECLSELNESNILPGFMQEVTSRAVEKIQLQTVIQSINHSSATNLSSPDTLTVSADLNELCSLLSPLQFASVHLLLLRRLFELLRSCLACKRWTSRCVSQWDKAQVRQELGMEEAHDALNASDIESLRQVHLVLRNQMPVLWQHHQNTLITFLGSLRLLEIGIEEFICVFHSSLDYLTMGDKICAANSDGVRGVLLKKAAQYMSAFVGSSLNQLMDQIQIDSWQTVVIEDPLQLNSIYEKLQSVLNRQRLSITSLAQSLSNKMPSYDQIVAAESPFVALVEFQLTSLKNVHAIHTEVTRQNSFNESPEIGSSPSLSDSQKSPVLTSCTLLLLKFMFRYVFAAKQFQSQGAEILQSAFELIEFHIYSVLVLFGLQWSEFFSSEPSSRIPSLYSNLFSLVNRVKHRIELGASVASLVSNDSDQSLSLIKFNPQSNLTANLFEKWAPLSKKKPHSVEKLPVATPVEPLIRLSQKVDLESPESMFGVIERLVAVESVCAFGAIFTKSIAPMFASNFSEYSSKIDDFCVIVEKSTSQLKNYIYRNLPPLIVPIETFLKSLQSVNWNCDEIGSQPNPYIEHILIQLKTMQRLYLNLNRKFPTLSIRNEFWREVINYLCEIIVSEWSQIETISTSGLGQMQLDIAAFQSGIENLELLSKKNCEKEVEYCRLWIQAHYYQTQKHSPKHN